MTNKNIDLTNLSLPDVISLMVSSSGKTVEEVSAEVGWSTSVAQRISNPAENYWPGLPTIPRFCVACGSTLIIDWLVAQIEIGGVDLDTDCLDWTGLLLTLTDMERELGDVAREVREAIEPDKDDGVRRISRTEAKRIIREVQDVIGKGVDLINGLRPTAGKGGA